MKEYEGKINLTNIVLLFREDDENYPDSMESINSWLNNHCFRMLSPNPSNAEMSGRCWATCCNFTDQEFDVFLNVVSNAGWQYPKDVQLLVRAEDMTKFQMWSIKVSAKMVPSVTVTPR